MKNKKYNDWEKKQIEKMKFRKKVWKIIGFVLPVISILISMLALKKSIG